MANCPICQSGVTARPLCKVNLGFAADYDLVECAACGVRRLDPLPSVEELSKFYASKDYGRDWYKQQGLGMAFAKSALRYKAGGRFLDVGCGQGFFLDGIRRHSDWEVHGTEFTPALARFAARELGLDVRHGELADVSFPDSHSAWYSRNISGKIFLNCSAIPLPMTPTVLTVLTSASTSASRRVPVGLVDHRASFS